MPSLSFMKCWKDKVRSGEKRQTIRRYNYTEVMTEHGLLFKPSVRHAPGLTEHLFSGMRTKYCERLGRARCTGVALIMRDSGRHGWRFLCQIGRRNPAFAGKKWNDTIGPRRLFVLARQDGFETDWEFDSWFKDAKPGDVYQIITWGKLEKGGAA